MFSTIFKGFNQLPFVPVLILPNHQSPEALGENPLERCKLQICDRKQTLFSFL